LKKLESVGWDIVSMGESVERFGKERFRKEIKDLVNRELSI